MGLNYGAYYCVPNLGIYNRQIRIYALVGPYGIIRGNLKSPFRL